MGLLSKLEMKLIARQFIPSFEKFAFLFFYLCFFFIAFWGAGAAFQYGDRTAIIATGLYISMIQWLIGLAAVSGLTSSDDNQLRNFAPLTNRALMTQNLKNSIVPLFIYYLVTPIAILGIGHWAILTEVKTNGILTYHLLLNIILFHFLCFAVPLLESLSNRHWGTRIVFSLRLPFHWGKVASFVITIAFFVFFMTYVSKLPDEPPYVFTTKPWAVNALNFLYDHEFVGCVFVFLLSPISGVFMAHSEAVVQPLSWVITLYLSVMLIWCCYCIRPLLNAETEVHEDHETGLFSWLDALNKWQDRKITERREREEKLAEQKRIDQDEDDPSSIDWLPSLAKDEKSLSANDQAATSEDIWPYQEKLTPESQIVSQWEQADVNCFRPYPRPLGYAVFKSKQPLLKVTFFVGIFWFIIALWPNFQSFDPEIAELSVGMLLFCVPLALLLDYSSSYGFALSFQFFSESCLPLPLHWPRLIKHQLICYLRHKVLVDAIYSLVITLMFGGSLLVWPLIFLCLFLWRVYMLLYVWQDNPNLAGTQQESQAGCTGITIALILKAVVYIFCVKRMMAQGVDSDAALIFGASYSAITLVLLGMATLSIGIRTKKNKWTDGRLPSEDRRGS